MIAPTIVIKICGCGGIGRLIGFRFQRASVQVRVLSSAPIIRAPLRGCSYYLCRQDENPSNATVRWTVAGRRLDGGHTLIFSHREKMQIESCHPHQRKKRTHQIHRCVFYITVYRCTAYLPSIYRDFPQYNSIFPDSHFYCGSHDHRNPFAKQKIPLVWILFLSST